MDGKIRDRKRTRRLLREIGKPGGMVAGLAIALPFFSGLLLVAQAFMLADILHRAIIEGAGLADLKNTVLWLAGILCLRAALSFAGERAATSASEAIKAALRDKIFSKVMAGKIGEKGMRSSGALTVAMIEHVDQLEGYYARFRPAAIQAACLPLAFGLAVMKVDIVVALLFIVTAPLIPLFMALAGWGAEAAMREQSQALSRLSGHFADRLRGIVTLKLFGRAEAESIAVQQAGDALRKGTLGVLKIAFLSSAILEFFAALGVAGVALYVGLTYLGFLHMASGLSLRNGLFCLLMAPEVYQPLRLLAAHYHDKKSAESALDEIEAQAGELDVLAAANTPAIPTKSNNSPEAARGLSLRIPRLSIATSRERIILKDIALNIPAGMHAVLAGESGAGKTSLLQTIAGLRAIDGEILLDERPMGKIPETDFRREVAILNQRPFLFRGSIADNLRLANAKATDADLHRAGEMACLFRNSADRSLRLGTMLGDGGSGISGGQIQRLSLARIFLRNPRLLLLDEPTAHLDPDTEAVVLDSLIAFAKGRTMIMATHSNAAINRFQHIFRISETAIIQTRHHTRPYTEADAA